MKPLSIFVDSDVIISSLISISGAAHLLLGMNLKFCLSDISVQELKAVAIRLKISSAKLQNLIKKKCQTIKIGLSSEQIKKKYQKYVIDPDDAHVIAGAKIAKVRFLVTYNIRHFRQENIKQNLGIIILTPAQLLQYLRSLA